MDRDRRHGDNLEEDGSVGSNALTNAEGKSIGVIVSPTDLEVHLSFNGMVHACSDGGHLMPPRKAKPNCHDVYRSSARCLMRRGISAILVLDG